MKTCLYLLSFLALALFSRLEAQQNPLQAAALENAKVYDLQSALIHPEEAIKLEITNRGYNPPITLPNDLERLENLRWVKIVDFPEFNFAQALTVLGRLPNLEILVLRYNRLEILPREIERLKNLRVLDVSFNSLKLLPSQIGELQSLKELHAAGNMLEELPPSLTQLQDLRVLSLGEVYDDDKSLFMGNMFKRLPPHIKELKNLEVLRLAENAELDFLKVFQSLANQPKLKVLDLSKNFLKEIPPVVRELKTLEKLEVSYNQLSALPHEIGDLGNLRELRADGNLINFIPPEIGNLKKLELISLSGDVYFGFNQISTLPFEIGFLSNLRHLNLMGNPIISLPSQIASLKNLHVLNLAGFKSSGYKQQPVFRRLPNEMVQLTQLKLLDLSCTPVLSSEIERLKQSLPQTQILQYPCR